MTELTGTDLATLGMAAFTAWLAWETRRMAKASSDANTLAETPYFAIAQFNLTQGNLVGTAEVPPPVVAQAVLRLKNPGRVRVSFEFEQAQQVIPESPGLVGGWDNRTGVLHPDEELSFYLPPVRLSRPFQVGDVSNLTIRVRYWSQVETRSTLTVSVRHAVVSIVPLQIRWSYTNGPTYA